MMPTPNIKTSALLGVALALASCAAPKAVSVEQAVPKKEEKLPEPVLEEMVALPDDGMRMPDMVGMPSDGDFRSTNPVGQKSSSGSGAVISRPPTDPPSRVKPKATE